MSKKVIKPESILAQCFSVLLKNGITNGITENMYNDFVDEFSKKVNIYSSRFGDEIIVEPDSFENIVQRMNKIHSSTEDGIRLETIIGDGDKKELIAFPNYNLARWKYDLFNMRLFESQEKIFKDTILSKSTQYFPTFSMEIIKEIPDVAKKAASFFVNDLIERYVKSRISKGYWPSQCRNVDEYIFKRNIGKCIDEAGTIETFKKAYVYAINVVCLLIADEKKDTIEISNNPYNMLAHANFLKFVMPEEFSFLKPYVYNEYEEHDVAITLTIFQNRVKFRSSACVYSDPYGEWSDEYKYEKGEIGNQPVEIMERRIGAIA